MLNQVAVVVYAPLKLLVIPPIVNLAVCPNLATAHCPLSVAPGKLMTR